MLELTESMRQRNDTQFAELLMRVRTATCTEEDMALLRSRQVCKTDVGYPADALHVFKTNAQVDDHNMDHLLKLPSQVFHIQAIDKKKDVHTGLVDVVISPKPSDTGGLRHVVSVGIGARVMVTLNIDVADGLANGVCGTVVAIDSTGTDVLTILVHFDSDRVGKQAIANSQYRQRYPGAVPIQRKETHFFAGQGRTSVEAKRVQFPLSLAWGCTIHKVQGKTLDTIVVSMEGRGGFNPGQAYVAFSRVRQLTGLHLLGFNASSIRVSLAVQQEMSRLQSEPSPIVEQPSFADADESSLKINLLNIRSYLEHLEDLKSNPAFLQTDVFCFTETYLRDGQQLSEDDLILPNSKCFRANRPSVSGRGGVMTVALQQLSPGMLPTTIRGLEYTAVAIKKKDTTINVLTIYRPPSMNSSVFKDKLQTLLLSLPTDVLTVILGDFNYDLMDSPNHIILKLFNQFGFKQHVKVPTTDYGSLLDHVYVNTHDTGELLVHVMDVYFSDHDLICISIGL